MSALVKFVLKAASDLAFVPALKVMHTHRRHFELYIGFMQIFSAFMYNAVDSLGFDFYLRKNEWHFMSDVFSITYVCVLSLHYCQLRNPDHATALRYLAFTLAWVSKSKDGFASQITQAIVIGAYIGAAVLRMVLGLSHISKIHRQQAYTGAGLTVLAAALICIEMGTAGTALNKILGGDTAISLALAGAHVLAGAAMHALWSACPVMDAKKLDNLPGYI